MDWAQLWEITTLPDNIPIVAMLFLIPYFGWLGFKQARANDRLIEQLEADPKLAKTHHRKTWPWQAHWARELHVWPYLLRIEFLAVIVVTAVLFVWSITLNAPLEEPANPNLTMNPSKAPWYFLGLQEMLVYFDPWIAGVVMPSIMIVGLMAFPYVDSNPLGVGYYTWKQRKVAIGSFLVGFVTWLILIVIGTFMRGPGWIWFWPGQTWDHNTVIYEVNRDLPDIVGITTQPWKGIFGAVVVGIFFVVTAFITHKIVTYNKFERKIFERTSLLQYVTFQVLAITILWALPVKLILRLLFRIKYVWVTPWFNV
ncbi:MAG TPA: cytochrome C [Blastocatellia bacterium]|nr:cytochrome C [Blastocatellia bacterium]